MTENPDIVNIVLVHILIFPLLYAETHYRFPYFFSFLRKKEPEIIADIPLRILTGATLPILLVIKDADKYPVYLSRISVSENEQTFYSETINKQISSSYEDLIFYMTTSELTCGKHQFDIRIDYLIDDKAKTCFADNHRGTRHKPLSTYILQDPIPRFNNCYFGETHSHSNYTSDQIEFGASLQSTQVMAKALEMDFFCVTDHSYDLDDYKDNYLLNDPNLGKWTDFHFMVKKLNQKDKAIFIIPGEEVTVCNTNGKNVHLLIYNSPKFFPGSGDSGEKWLKNDSELSISEIIGQMDDSSLVVAAHPSETPPILQKLLINRGSWQPTDCAEKGLHGLQFINGGENKYIIKGKHLWIEQLLSDNRLTGIAGNDAHGNFSRFRQIGFPFFTMREHHHHLFGKWFTGIYLPNAQPSINSLLDALRAGNCYMTNGPAVSILLENTHKSYNMGEECSSPVRAKLKVLSNRDFGEVKNIQLILGNLEKKQESPYYQELSNINKLDYVQEISLENLPNKGYFRIEVKTEYRYQALSNPIWFHT